MQASRAQTLLQSVADVRLWIAEHVPCTQSMLGYDLFLKMGKDFFEGKPIDLAALQAELPYSDAELGAYLAEMETAGLLLRQPGADGRPALLPTARFVALLNLFVNKFESLLIPRKQLRERQLVLATSDPDLRALVETLYDRFYDLGWLYLHNFGSVCFLMASLVGQAVLAHGQRAALVSCYVEVNAPKRRFYLGAKGYARPGQVEGHCACVVNDSLIVDFGLGNMRTGYRRDFPWAIALPYAPVEHVLGSATLASGDTAQWKSDWQSPDTEAELSKFTPTVATLMRDYHAQYG